MVLLGLLGFVPVSDFVVVVVVVVVTVFNLFLMLLSWLVCPVFLCLYTSPLVSLYIGTYVVVFRVFSCIYILLLRTSVRAFFLLLFLFCGWSSVTLHSHTSGAFVVAPSRHTGK